jgi:CO dehydrogenase/acetyl-CoA synthase beta subunit
VGKIEPGTRVVFVTSPDPGSSGAEVLLDGKCLAKIAKEAPNREIYSAMLVNISAGTYEVTIRKNGYTDVHKEVTVSASDRPVEQTPKIVVPFSMQPH